jgi:hypothetical protein
MNYRIHYTDPRGQDRLIEADQTTLPEEAALAFALCGMDAAVSSDKLQIPRLQYVQRFISEQLEKATMVIRQSGTGWELVSLEKGGEA